MKKTVTDDSLLFARVDDALRAAERHAVRFLPFLDEREQAAVLRHLSAKRTDAVPFFWGGYPDAERRMPGFFPPHETPCGETFPLTAVRVSWKREELTHRDFLGALLSLGIRREKVGDLLVRPQDCVACLEDAVAALVLSDLSRVGRAAVVCAVCDGGQMQREDTFAALSGTVASERLDCVVSALTGCSRAQAEADISAGRVALNFLPVSDRAHRVNAGTALSVRGQGRYVVDTIGPPTKKGRLRFAARKYM